MIHYCFLINRLGKCRMEQWYDIVSEKDQAKILRETTALVLGRTSKLCNFIEYRGLKIVYKRYASLFFIIAIDPTDNEFITLEIIQQYVESLDTYFGSVCELDLVFSFHKAYYLLYELIMSGEIMETSKKVIYQAMMSQDLNEAVDLENVPEV
ncbi:Adaptor protein complex 1 (AP-1), sigma subunit [Blattamonas nauphoetae]|uniref:AP complex subunit sigma n=1 Tax=Blattamonas nauphoetae TaxID=2049346 RepID=A0ABQ9Y5Y2_9EUKA|nr:Adaptor protein complex 1 (AP-1), sigma subunit [Blattamonas nauphoetae]